MLFGARTGGPASKGLVAGEVLLEGRPEEGESLELECRRDDDMRATRAGEREKGKWESKYKSERDVMGNRGRVESGLERAISTQTHTASGAMASNQRRSVQRTRRGEHTDPSTVRIKFGSLTLDRPTTYRLSLPAQGDAIHRKGNRSTRDNENNVRRPWLGPRKKLSPCSHRRPASRQGKATHGKARRGKALPTLRSPVSLSLLCTAHGDVRTARCLLLCVYCPAI